MGSTDSHDIELKLIEKVAFDWNIPITDVEILRSMNGPLLMQQTNYVLKIQPGDREVSYQRNMGSFMLTPMGSVLVPPVWVDRGEPGERPARDLAKLAAFKFGVPESDVEVVAKFESNYMMTVNTEYKVRIKGQPNLVKFLRVGSMLATSLLHIPTLTPEQYAQYVAEQPGAARAPGAATGVQQNVAGSEKQDGSAPEF